MSSSRCRSAASRSNTRWTRTSGALVVDRFLYTSMRYPGNYGFIPHTLSGDGDPCDVIVANTRAIVPGAIMSCRIVGVLLMEDEAGGDEKLIAVPSAKLTQRYDDVANYTDLPPDHPRPDRALLRPLQGPGARQMGQDRRLARRRRGPASWCWKGSSGRRRRRRGRGGEKSLAGLYRLSARRNIPIKRGRRVGAGPTHRWSPTGGRRCWR